MRVHQRARQGGVVVLGVACLLMGLVPASAAHAGSEPRRLSRLVPTMTDVPPRRAMRTAPVSGLPAGSIVGGTDPAAAVAVADTGGISGTVTDEATGDPIAGICVRAALNDWTASTVTDAAGAYAIAGLATAEYRVAFVDWCDGSQDYVGEWFDDRTDFLAADLVAVSAPDVTSGVDAALTPGGSVSGTVTDEATGEPLEGICVSAGDPRTDSLVSGTTTDADGTYTVTGLSTGEYGIVFWDVCDASIEYAREWYDDRPSFASADLIQVTAPSGVTGIDAALETGGSIAGTVTDAATGDPVGGICVRVYHDDSGDIATFAETEADGSYVAPAVPTGSYAVGFSDFCDASRTYLESWYDGRASFSTADPVIVTAPEVTTGIDAALEQGGSISGTVWDDATGEPIAGICVSAADPGTDSLVSGTTTDAAGHYTIGVLRTGSYGVLFFDVCDSSTDYEREWFDDRRSFAEADLVSVTAPDEVSGIDAGLGPVNFTLTVQATGSGLGTVTSEPAGISCGVDCSEDFDKNVHVVLTAVPRSDSTFSGWTGDCVAAGSTAAVTMTADKECSAAFSTGAPPPPAPEPSPTPVPTPVPGCTPDARTVCGTTGSDDITIADDADHLVVTGDGDDVITITGDGATTIDTGDGDDTVLVTGDGPTHITTGGGDDDVRIDGAAIGVLATGAGADSVLAGPGDDSVRGGAGQDDLRGRGGNDVLLGGVGDDDVRGGTGDDEVAAGRGDDSLLGGPGDDSMAGGAGNDAASGGPGVDHAVGCESVRGV